MAQAALYDPDFTLPLHASEAPLGKVKRITFDADGTARFIHDDDIAGLLREIGPVEVKRASHVEPYGDGWTVDMSPVGGPLLGPFETRAFALAFEVEWLKQNRGM
jgi:hypothetical protein